MRKYLAALVAALPLLASCADAPTETSFDPQAAFASNPPPPPVSGLAFGFIGGEGSFDQALVPLMLATPGNNNGSSSASCAFDFTEVCMPARFFQNGPGTNTWLNFTNDVGKLPKEVKQALGASQSPGRIQYSDGFTRGQGFAWGFDLNGVLYVLDLSQFSGVGNLLNLQRSETGEFECVAIGSLGDEFVILRVTQEGDNVTFTPEPFVLFQFGSEALTEHDEHLCFPLEID